MSILNRLLPTPRRSRLLLTVAVGVSLALCLAPSKVKAGKNAYLYGVPLQYHNSDCGADHSESPTIGYIDFERAGTHLEIHAVIEGGEPNASYDIFLYSARCDQRANFGFVYTDSSGNGELYSSTRVRGRRFFATANGPGNFEWNDSPIVSLR